MSTKLADSVVAGVGKRLRIWRDQRNLSGPEVAAVVATVTGRAFEWPELRRCEVGRALPDTHTAIALAAVFDETLRDLLGLPARSTAPLAVDDLVRRAQPSEVARDVAELWLECQLPVAEALTWIDDGWDLLSALPWAAADLEPAVAALWARGGVDYLDIPAVGRNFTPEEAAEWGSSEIPLEEWIPWRDLQFPPAAAQAWRRVPLQAHEAIGWSAAGIDPLDAVVYVDAGLSSAQAAQWQQLGFEPRDAVAWFRGGLGPSDAQAWTAASLTPQTAEAFADLKVAPDLVRRWLDAERDEGDLRHWLKAGVPPEDAADWSFTSPARASRLIRRGIGPAQVLERQVHARRALAEANGWSIT